MIEWFHNKKIFLLGIAATRLFLGLVFFTAGMSKLTQAFPGLIGPVWLEEKLAPYGLGLYARFIAWSQVIIGLLVLSRRFATLGAVMMLPLILNILAVTISLEWRGTPYVVSGFLVMNIALLVWDYHKLKFLIADHHPDFIISGVYRRNRRGDAVWLSAFVLVLASVPVIQPYPLGGYIMVVSGLITFIFCQFAPKLKLQSGSAVEG